LPTWCSSARTFVIVVSDWSGFAWFKGLKFPKAREERLQRCRTPGAEFALSPPARGGTSGRSPQGKGCPSDRIWDALISGKGCHQPDIGGADALVGGESANRDHNSNRDERD
jgi:hypothetical protein